MSNSYNELNSKKNSGVVANQKDRSRTSATVVEKIREQSFRNISQFMQELFDSCDDLFYDLSNQANNNREQALYFDSMREIRLKRQGLERDYMAHFNASFQRLVSPQYKAATIPVINRLAIVENDAMEIDVALINMLMRANNAYSEEIYNLQTCLNCLLTDIDVNKENNPLAPELICYTFADTCKANLAISIKPLIILLKQFERFVLERMGQIYADANQLLVEAGMSPKIPQGVNKGNSFATISKQQVQSVESTSDTPARDQNRFNNRSSRAYESCNGQFSPKTFKRLLPSARSGSTGLNGFNSYSDNPGPLISLPQLANLLNRAQILIDQDNIERPHLHDITSKLLSDQCPKDPRAVGESEENIINLVARFFEFILDDSNIALKLRNQISRLQIPVLKLALRDDAFFSNSLHPARDLINTIAAVGVIYNDDRDLNKDKTYQSIVDIVKTICHQYAFDDDIFAELLPQLEKVIEKEQCRSTVVEKRTLEIEAGKSKVKAASKIARTLLLKKLHGAELFTIARDFLINRWLNVMIMTLLKFSAQSKEWLAVTQTVDDFIWCCQGNKDAEELKHLQPDLLGRIGLGLALLGKSSSFIEEELERVKNLIKANMRATNKIARKENLEISQTTDLREVSNKPKTAIARQQEQCSKIRNEELQQVNDIKPGDRIKYEDMKTGKTPFFKRTLTKIFTSLKKAK
jgi:Protein of unknown function (DUF1631)